MRKIALAATAALSLALALAACSPPDSMEDTKPESSMSQSSDDAAAKAETASGGKSGEFMGLNEKNVSGSVTVTADEIALSGFSSDEGPDLHVYLAKGTDEAAVTAGMLVDAVSFDTASQTFDLDDVDTADYTYVVIYCDKAKAVFGAAELS